MPYGVVVRDARTPGAVLLMPEGGSPCGMRHMPVGQHDAFLDRRLGALSVRQSSRARAEEAKRRSALTGVAMVRPMSNHSSSPLYNWEWPCSTLGGARWLHGGYYRQVRDSVAAGDDAARPHPAGFAGVDSRAHCVLLKISGTTHRYARASSCWAGA